MTTQQSLTLQRAESLVASLSAEVTAERVRLKVAVDAIEAALGHLNATTPSTTFSVAVFEVGAATKSLRSALATVKESLTVQPEGDKS